MKKMSKKILAFMLAAVMVIGTAPLSGLVGLDLPDFADIFGIKAEAAIWDYDISDYEVGNIVAFGQYPKTEVRDSELLSKLNSLELEWKSYDYYSGMYFGKKINYIEQANGQMTAKDYMKYADVTFCGEKYRAVTFSTFRPTYTGYKSIESESYVVDGTSSGSYTRQDINEYGDINRVYWFKYEPIGWVVIDSNEGLLLSNSVVDSQPFNDFVVMYRESGYNCYYNSIEKTNRSNDYESCSLRQWLNSDFYNTAFRANEKLYMKNHTFNNNVSSSVLNDKVFLASKAEAEILGDADKRSAGSGSDYAECQGIDKKPVTAYYGNHITWWLRDSDGVSTSYVSYGGYYDETPITNNTSIGVRPVIKIGTGAEFKDYSYGFGFGEDVYFTEKNKEIKIDGFINYLGLKKSYSSDFEYSVYDDDGNEIISDKIDVNIIDNKCNFSVEVDGLDVGDYTLTVTDGLYSNGCKISVYDDYSDLNMEVEKLKSDFYSLNGFLFDEYGNYYAGAFDISVKLTNKLNDYYASKKFTQEEIDSAAFDVKFTVEVNEGFNLDGAGTRKIEYEYKPLKLKQTEEIKLKIYQEDETAQEFIITYNAYIDGELKHTDTETVTIKSYQEQYTKEHVLALYDKNGYYYPLNYSFAQYMLPMEDAWDYQWQKAMSDGLVGTISNYMHGDLDEKKAYDLVIADLVNSMYNEETVEEISLTIYSEEFTKIVKEASKGLVEVAMSMPELKEQLDDLAIKDFSKVFTGGASAEVMAIYKAVLNTEKGKNAMKSIVSKASKVDDCFFVLDKVGVVFDSYNDYTKAVNALAAMNTFSQMDEVLIEVFREMYECSSDNPALQKSLHSYLTYMNDSKLNRVIRIIQTYVESGSVTATKVSFMAAKGIYMFTVKDIISKGLSSFLDVAGGVISGIEWGCYLSDFLCNSTDYSTAISKVIAAGKISIVLEKAVKKLGENVETTMSFSNAVILDRGLNLFREVEQYAYKNTIAAMDAEVNSCILTEKDPLSKVLFKDRRERYYTEITELIIESARMDYLFCHDLQLEKIASQVTNLSSSVSSFRKTPPEFKVVNVRCPVDVSVYDGTKLLVSFVGDEIAYLADGITALAYYDEKYVCLPSTADFDIVITATENGKMKYSVEEYDENGTSVREVFYENIDLKNGQVFTGIINDEALTPAENYDLRTDGKVISNRNDSVNGDVIGKSEIKLVGNADVGVNVPTQFMILCSKLPDNAKINWTCNDTTVKLTPAEDGMSCLVVAEKIGSAILTASVAGSDIESDFEFTASEKKYTVKWYIGDSSVLQTYSYGEKVVTPEFTVPEDSKFLRWSSEIPETMPARDLSVMAVLETTKYTCDYCGGEFDNKDEYNEHLLYEEAKKNFSAVIATPSTTTIKYGDSIILHAEITGELPAGATVQWSTDNGNFEKVAANDGMTCKITPKSNGDTTVTMKVISAEGDVIAEDTQVMTSKAGFFDKIIGFFKKLFGLTKTIPQYFKSIF